MTYSKPITNLDKNKLKRLIHVKKWDGEKLENHEGTVNPGIKANFVASTTWSGLDFAAGGRTKKEAEENLYNYLI